MEFKMSHTSKRPKFNRIVYISPVRPAPQHLPALPGTPGTGGKWFLHYQQER